MREHAIPQDITGYRFHIIGNMTLKQFAEIGAGCVVGFLFYTTNLPTIIKWPLIGLSVGLGALVAFVPIEERPLDHWVTTFFKVLYKPTKFFWRREQKIPEAFTYTPLDNVVNEQQEVDLRPARKERIKEYLQSVEPPKVVDQFDWDRLQQIDNIMSTFDNIVVPTVQAQEGTQKPDLKVRVRSLVTPNPLDGPMQPPIPEVAVQQDPAFAFVAQVQEQQQPPPQAPTPQITLPATPTMAAQEPAPIQQVAPRDPVLSYEVVNPAPTPPVVATSPTQQPPQEVVIPNAQQIAVAASLQAVPTDTTIPDTQQNVYVPEAAVTPVNSDQQVTLNTQLPFPTAPTEPNKVVGMCLTSNNEIIEGAIVEIQSPDGQVARAVKTNTLGQFFVTTPLENGSYTVIVEKEGLSFSPLRLDITGDVVPPLEIRSL